MGNWTTVKMVGTCDAKEVQGLHDAVAFDINDNDGWDGFNCLSDSGGMCGLGNWAGETINATGNLAERNYDANNVARVLVDLVKIAPSLDLKVHVGGDFEDKKCVATVTCKAGEVTTGDPEIESIGELDEDKIMENLMKQLGRG